MYKACRAHLRLDSSSSAGAWLAISGDFLGPETGASTSRETTTEASRRLMKPLSHVSSGWLAYLACSWHRHGIGLARPLWAQHYTSSCCTENVCDSCAKSADAPRYQTETSRTVPEPAEHEGPLNAAITTCCMGWAAFTSREQ